MNENHEPCEVDDTAPFLSSQALSDLAHNLSALTAGLKLEDVDDAVYVEEIQSRLRSMQLSINVALSIVKLRLEKWKPVEEEQKREEQEEAFRRMGVVR